jgi:hypothetical protein
VVVKRKITSSRRESNPRTPIVQGIAQSRSFINFYSSPNSIKAIKLGRMEWVGHVTRMRKVNNVYKIVVGNSQGEKSLERPERHGRIISEWRGVDNNELGHDRSTGRLLRTQY